MIKFLLSIQLGISLLIGTSLVWAAPQMQSTLSSEQIGVDETTVLKIEVQWRQSEGAYSFVLPDTPVQNLIIERRGESQEAFQRGGENWDKKTFLLEFKPVSGGKASIGSFTIQYLQRDTDPELQEKGSFVIEQSDLWVKIPVAKWVQPALAGGGLTIFIGGALLLFFRLRKRNSPEVGPQGPSREDVFLERIQSLSNSDRAISAKEKLQILSGELRKFVIEHYQLPMPQATEHEVVQELTRRDIAMPDIKELKQLFAQLGEAKFSGLELSGSEWNRLQNSVVRYIEGKRIVGQTVS